MVFPAFQGGNKYSDVKRSSFESNSIYLFGSLPRYFSSPVGSEFTHSRSPKQRAIGKIALKRQVSHFTKTGLYVIVYANYSNQ